MDDSSANDGDSSGDYGDYGDYSDYDDDYLDEKPFLQKCCPDGQVMRQDKVTCSPDETSNWVTNANEDDTFEISYGFPTCGDSNVEYVYSKVNMSHNIVTDGSDTTLKLEVKYLFPSLV